MTQPSVKPESTDATRAVFDRLIDLARRQEADAAMIDTAVIDVKDNLARMCRKPGCPSYGLAASCPPHVGGPDQFREWQKTYRQALLIKLDVPTESLLGNDRQKVFRKLHIIAASVEKCAIDAGYERARAFAGGSCKELFCKDLPACPAITESGACLHPEHARPSMSGYGIDVFKLMATVGWKTDRLAQTNQKETPSVMPIAALVLIH